MSKRRKAKKPRYSQTPTRKPAQGKKPARTLPTTVQRPPKRKQARIAPKKAIRKKTVTRRRAAVVARCIGERQYWQIVERHLAKLLDTPSLFVARPAVPLREREVIRWRKGSKWVKPGTAGAVPHTWMAQLNRDGRIVRMLEHVTPTQIMKTVLSGSRAAGEKGPLGLEEDVPVAWTDAKSGHSQGMLRYAFEQANVYTTLNQHAARIEITIKGTDTRERVQRIKLSIVPESQRKLHELVISRIITAMRDVGLRTTYSLDILNAAKAVGPLVRPLSTRKFQSLEPLHDVEIVVTVYH